MARESSIKIYRSTGTSAPASLSAGELAWIDDNGAGTLYIGDATAGAVKTIGGAPGGDWGTALRTDTALLGTTTMAALTGGVGAFDLTASNATAATQTTGNSSTKLATTAFVATAVSNAAPDMNAISDTDIGTGAAAPAAGHVLIYDGTNSWDNQPISGDVSIAADGTSSVISVANNAVQMATDTDGNFVSAVTAVAGETSVNISSGVGNAGDSVAVGLATNIVTQGNLTIAGDLIVSGNTTQVNTNTIELEDPMLVLGDGSPSTTGDRGIEVRYNNSGAQTGFFGLDSTDQSFRFYKTAVINATTNIVDSANAGSVLGNAFFGEIDGTTIDASVELVAPLATVTSVVATNLTGELQTAAQPNVTEIGTITAGAWNADKIEQAYGGTGRTATTNNDLLIGNSGGPMTVLAMGSADKFLHVNAAGNALEYTDTMDGGSF